MPRPEINEDHINAKQAGMFLRVGDEKNRDMAG